MQLETATKAQFAAMIGVSPGRVSQYISERKLGPAELEGEGRAAKVRIGPALQALKIRLDAGQMTGNGLATKLSPPRRPQADVPSAPSVSDDLDLKFKQAKLAEQESRNRKLAEEERARAGVYVLADDAKAETVRMAAQMLQAFEGGLSDMAAAIAAQYHLPQRDVVHMVRAQFRELRSAMANRMANEGKALPPLLEVHDESVPSVRDT